VLLIAGYFSTTVIQGVCTMEKKSELTAEKTVVVGGRTLRRIRAMRDLGDVNAGELDGFVKSQRNLSHDGTARVSG
jgi:hypothetical protein